MPRYLCELVYADGSPAEEIREAATSEEAAALFARSEGALVAVRDLGVEAAARRRCAGAEEVRELSTMLSALLGAGLSLKDSLAVAAAPGERATRRGRGTGARLLAEELLRSVEKGASFREAVEARGGFPRFYLGMVGIGERIGSVERVLPRLTSYLSEMKAVRDKVAGALVYPAIVVGLSILGAALILLVLLPELLSAFAQLGGSALDRVRRGSEAMTRASVALGAALAVLPTAALALRSVRASDSGAALAIDGLVLRLPAAGALVSAWETLGFAFAMETLSAGGLSVEASLAAAAEVAGNRAYRSALGRCQAAAIRGETLSAAAALCPELPPRIAAWLSIGESTGRVDLAFAQLRLYYQGEVERASSRLAALAEPVLVAFAGCLLLAMVLCFVVPLFSMFGAVL